MGVCGGKNTKKNVEEENKKKEEQDNSKSKEISKENDKEKEKEKEKEKGSSKKQDSKSNNKEEKVTNPIINQNNLQPSKDNILSKQFPAQTNQNKNESQKIFPQSNAPLPSAINSVKMNIEGTSSVFPISLNPNKNIKSENENDIDNLKSNLLPNENLIAPIEGQLFLKTMTNNQLKNFQNYNRIYYPEGEHFIISFGDCFDIFNDFFINLYSEHELDKEQPLYSSNIFFENEDNDNYKARGIAFNIPNDYYDIYLKSEINDLYSKSNIIFNTNKKSKTNLDANSMKNATLKEFLNTNPEKSDDFIKEFKNNSNYERLNNLLRKEEEKCHHLRCLHLLGNIFDGNSMGILCNFIEHSNEELRKVINLVHLKYYDTFEHKAFTKIKNYIYSISNLYDKCELVNFFNCPKGGEILSCITAGERILGKGSGYSINQMLADLLVNPKMNYLYSNGLELKEKDVEKIYFELLFRDCKEDRSHTYYKPQMSSLAIYKGNKILNNESKIILSKEMNNIVDKNIANNRSYYNFYEINKEFEINDFISNLHQSQYFVRYTEGFFMDFVQNYNNGNFTNLEKETKEDTINNVHGILNNFKELWRYEV